MKADKSVHRVARCNKQLLEAVRGGAIEKGQQLDAGQVDYLMSQIIQVAKDLDFDVGEKFYQ